MKPTEELTKEDLNIDGCVRLMIHLLWTKMKDRDIDWLKSDECLATLSYIPSHLLPKFYKSDGAKTHAYAKSIQDLQQTLVDRLLRGEKIQKPVEGPYQKVPQKRWAVTSPDGVTEIITSIRDYAEKEGLGARGRQGLTNACNRPNVYQYKGYRIRKILR